MEEEHEDPIMAARNGATEIGFAVVVSSITLAAVFVPVAFVTGTIGTFFYEFGLTVASAIFISTFIALTLTPMLCSRIIRVRKTHMGIYNVLENGFNRLGDAYESTLKFALSHRLLVVVLALVASLSGGYMAKLIPGEFAPAQDQGAIIAFMRGPEGSTLEYMDRNMAEMEQIVAGVPEVMTYMGILGFAGGPPSRGVMFMSLQDRDQRDRNQFDVMNDIRRQSANVPGILAFLRERSPFGGRQDTRPVQLVIQHPDLQVLAQGSEALVRKLRDTPGFIDVDSDLELNKPEVLVHIDRDRAANLGISVADISQSLQILMGGVDVTQYKERGKQYDVLLRLRDEDRSRPRNLEEIHVRARGGELVPLSNLVRIEEAIGPSQINHYNRIRSVTVAANLDGVILGDALDTVRTFADEIFPIETSYALSGTARDMEESFQALFFTLFLAIIVVFLVLAAQFNSWIHPFTIMLGLPLALVGAFGGLWLLGMTLNIFSFIGLIMLTGLVTKNGILLIDYANRQRDAGMERNEAVLKSGKVRLRPILMTAVTTIFGVLPIALGMGAGGEARAPLGVVVIGGMTVSTLLTLVVVPVIYTLLDDAMAQLKRRLGIGG
jgi:multidrug efflux pump subunit AcrB